jgi:hypothetical protein
MTFDEANSLIVVAAIGAGYGAYRADEAYVPVISSALDWVTAHVYLWCTVLPTDAWCLVSGLTGGLLVYLFLALLLAVAWRGREGGPLEARLKSRLRRQKREHYAGFNS